MYSLSKKGKDLISFYKDMHENGYYKSSGGFVSKDKVYNTFELYHYKEFILNIFREHNIKNVVDYGSGGSDWEKNNFHENMSAKDYFYLDKIITYEPSRNKNFITKLDSVVCFDVLEHIYINDLRKILCHIYENAKKLVILNVACFPAKALLPNKENAHITIRPPIWWKGYLDAISINYPEISTVLLCRVNPKELRYFKIWNNYSYDLVKNYRIDLE